MNDEQKKKSFWGKGIVILYSGFVLFILSFVFFSVGQDFELVESDYYQKELNYQKQIDRMRSTEQLTEKPVYAYIPTQNMMTVKFPESLYKNGVKGTISFFRPSSKEHDFDISLSLDSSGLQLVDLIDCIPGKYKFKLLWTNNSTEYYIEDMIFIE